jgi:hypothetical protein
MTPNEQHIRNVFELSNYKNSLMWLNAGNQAGPAEIDLWERLLKEFPDDELTMLKIGSAYGGGVEMCSKLIYGRGKVYGYDTFEGHPRDLADDQTDLEAWCMDMWYEGGKFKPFLSVDRLKYEYQRRILDEQFLYNAILVKGRVNEHSFDDIEKIHFAMLDMDLIKPTVTAYNAIKDKFVPCGYLCMHDTLPPNHLPKIHDFAYDVVLKDGRWHLENELPDGNVTIFKRKL